MIVTFIALWLCTILLVCFFPPTPEKERVQHVEVKVDRPVSQHLRIPMRSNPHTKLFLWLRRSSKNICNSSPTTASNVAKIVQFGKAMGKIWGVWCKGVQYVILQKFSSHPSLDIYFFATPPIKLKWGLKICGNNQQQTMWSNHYDSPIKNREQQ